MCLYLCAKSHAYLCVGSDQFTIITDIVIFFDWVQSIKRAILIETLFTIFFIQIYPLYIHISIVSLEIRWKEKKKNPLQLFHTCSQFDSGRTPKRLPWYPPGRRTWRFCKGCEEPQGTALDGHHVQGCASVSPCHQSQNTWPTEGNLGWFI